MEVIYLTFSSFFLVLIALTTADPDPWGDQGYGRHRSDRHFIFRDGSRGNYGYDHSHGHSYQPKRKTSKFDCSSIKMQYSLHDMDKYPE